MGWWEKGESASHPPSLWNSALPSPALCTLLIFFPCKTQIKAKGGQEKKKKKKGHVVVLKERPGSAEPSFATA